MSAGHPANHALLTLNAVGVKLVKNSAPCVIIALLSTEELTEFRADLAEAEAVIASTRKLIDMQLANELARRADLAEDEVRYGARPTCAIPR